AAAVGDESYPPENEGAHEDLAELEVSLYERTQVLAIHDDDRSIDGGARANEIAACGEHVDLTPGLAGAEHPHHVFAAGDGAHDLDAALDDEEEAGILLAELEQHVARADVPPLADTGDSADLSRRQLRKHLVAALDVHLCHVVISPLGGKACAPRYTGQQ